MSFGIVIVIFLLFILIGLGIGGVWYYLKHQPSVAPTNLQNTYVKGADGLYYYSFTWDESATDPTTYNITLTTSNGKTAAIGNTVVSSWTPKNGIPKGAYTINVVATTGSRPPSSPLTLNFTVASSSKEQYFVSNLDGGYLFESVAQTCSTDSDCPVDMSCDSTGTSCYYDPETMMSIGSDACQALGGNIATDTELLDAFNKGADWCATGVYQSSADETALFGYPTYNAGGGCGIESGDYPRIVSGSSSLTGSGIICTGIKPTFGKTVKVGKSQQGTVTTNFSTNLGMWSENSPWNKTAIYGCTNPQDVCKD